jgi:hypothetical protein
MGRLFTVWIYGDQAASRGSQYPVDRAAGGLAFGVLLVGSFLLFLFLVLSLVPK